MAKNKYDDELDSSTVPTSLSDMAAISSNNQLEYSPSVNSVISNTPPLRNETLSQQLASLDSSPERFKVPTSNTQNNPIPVNTFNEPDYTGNRPTIDYKLPPKVYQPVPEDHFNSLNYGPEKKLVDKVPTSNTAQPVQSSPVQNSEKQSNTVTNEQPKRGEKWEYKPLYEYQPNARGFVNSLHRNNPQAIEYYEKRYGGNAATDGNQQNSSPFGNQKNNSSNQQSSNVEMIRDGKLYNIQFGKTPEGTTTRAMYDEFGNKLTRADIQQMEDRALVRDLIDQATKPNSVPSKIKEVVGWEAVKGRKGSTVGYTPRYELVDQPGFTKNNNEGAIRALSALAGNIPSLSDIEKKAADTNKVNTDTYLEPFKVKSDIERNAELINSSRIGSDLKRKELGSYDERNKLENEVTRARINKLNQLDKGESFQDKMFFGLLPTAVDVDQLSGNKSLNAKKVEQLVKYVYGKQSGAPNPQNYIR